MADGAIDFTQLVPGASPRPSPAPAPTPTPIAAPSPTPPPAAASSGGAIDFTQLVPGASPQRSAPPAAPTPKPDLFERMGEATTSHWNRMAQALGQSPVGKAWHTADVKSAHIEKWPVFKALKDFSQLPAEGIVAGLGAPQRIIAMRIANMQKNPHGVAAVTAATGAVGPAAIPALLASAAARKEMGDELYAVTHPNDPTIQANMEAAMHVDRLLSKDPRFRGKVWNWAVHTGAQTITDPFAAFPAEIGESLLERAGAAGTRALRSQNPATVKFASTFLTNAEERKRLMPSDQLAQLSALSQKSAKGEALTKGEMTQYKNLRDLAKVSDMTQAQIAEVNTQRMANETFQRKWETKANNWLAQDKSSLKAGVMPERMRQRLLIEPYLFGSAKMRSDALKYGFDPQAAIARGDMTAAEAAMPPTGRVSYKVNEMYNPQSQEVRQPINFNPMLVGEMQKYRMTTKLGAEKFKAESLPINERNLYDRVQIRLQSGRNVIGNRQMVQGLGSALEIGDKAARGFLEKTAYGSMFGMKALSDVQTDAMLAVGVPHIRNIGVLGFLAMGEVGMAKAMARFIGKIPEALNSRLEKGAEEYFAPKRLHPLSPVRLVPEPARKATSAMLNKFDRAVRATRLEQLDAQLGDKVTEAQKLERVNQDIGDYANRPHYVRFARNFLGGNFPQWHGYVVPTAIMRAALRNPGQVVRLARYEQNFNDEFFPDSKYRFSMGGPLDESASGVADLARIATGSYPSYWGSASMIGPFASSVLHAPGAFASKGKALRDRLLGIPLAAVPGGMAAREAFFNPFKEPGTPGSRFAMSMLGPYMQKRSQGSRRRTAGIPTAAPAGGGAIDFSALVPK